MLAVIKSCTTRDWLFAVGVVALVLLTFGGEAAILWFGLALAQSWEGYQAGAGGVVAIVGYVWAQRVWALRVPLCDWYDPQRKSR